MQLLLTDANLDLIISFNFIIFVLLLATKT